MNTKQWTFAVYNKRTRELITDIEFAITQDGVLLYLQESSSFPPDAKPQWRVYPLDDVFVAINDK